MRSAKVIILGAGTAGLAAVKEVRKYTDDWLMVESGDFGTTCARSACMPSKVLIQIAHDWDRRHLYETQGIGGANRLTVDSVRVLERVREMRDHFVQGVVSSMKGLQRKTIRAHAKFIGPNLLDVGGETIRAKRVVIATGSRPIVPEAWKAFGKKIITSSDLFELKRLPASMAIVGLGRIGVEFGQALHRLGVRVEGFSRSRRVGGLSDPQLNKAAVAWLGAQFPVHFGGDTLIAAQNDRLLVSCKDGTAEVDTVLAAMGRTPNVEDLNLTALGIRQNAKGKWPVNRETGQLSDLPIFFAGDAGTDQPVLHVAQEEGEIAGHNSAVARPRKFERQVPLGITFSHPNIAVVGTPYSQLPKNAVWGEADFTDQGRAKILSENQGLMRVYAAKSGVVLGAEIFAPGGEHLAHLLALAVRHRLKISQVLQSTFYHPVLEEGLRTALKQAAGKL